MSHDTNINKTFCQKFENSVRNSENDLKECSVSGKSEGNMASHVSLEKETALVCVEFYII